MIGPERLKEIEPHSAGIRALWSPNTGIIDYTEVTEAYARVFQENGGDVLTGARVEGVSQDGDAITVETTRGDVSAKYMVNCAGLYAHDIAHMMGAPYDLRIIPFRGEYYTLSDEGAELVRGLIYPVPVGSPSWACTSPRASTAAWRPGRTPCWPSRRRATPSSR